MMALRKTRALTRLLAAVTTLAIAGMSFAACAKNKHEAIKAESTNGQLQKMYTEPADRPKTQHGYAEPPAIPECEPPDEDLRPERYPVAEPWYEIQGAPNGTNALSHALRARGGKDLMSGEELKAGQNAEAQLRFLATHGDLLIERQRALALLRNFPSENTRTLLMRLSEDANLHVSLRASALRSLVEIVEDEDEHEDAHKVLERAKQSDDPRIRKAVMHDESQERNR